MRTFKNFIKENVGTSDQNMAVDNGINPSEIQNPRVLKALNAYVGAIANMEYMLPEHALNKLKEKLGRLGFAFGAIPEMTEKSGSFDLPLTKFGGRFGKDLDTPTDEFLNDLISQILTRKWGENPPLQICKILGSVLCTNNI